MPLLHHSDPTNAPRTGSQLPEPIPRAPDEAPRHSHRASALSIGSVIVGTVGLAALLGLTMYANRRPRTPHGITPVRNFDLQRYMGKWYCVARTAHQLDKAMQRTQTEYTLNNNGTVQAIQRSYHPERGEWKISQGKARPTIAANVAAWKISYFGPFYNGYHVVALDDAYQWAMVVGSSLDELWILSRTPALAHDTSDHLLRQAHLLGIPMEKIHWIHQDGINPTGSYRARKHLR